MMVLSLGLWPLLLCGQGAFISFNGRNHPELSWSVYETDNFRIVYSTGLESTAQKAGNVAEQVYAVHQKNLGLSFKKKYFIYLSDMDEIVNGATSPFGYFFIWVKPTNYLTMFTGTDGWLKAVIAHEMVHALIFENAKGWLDLFLPVSAVKIGLDIQEGMAQFYAGEVWGLERGDRYLNQAVRNSSSANSSDIDFGPLLYAQGFAKIKWLRQSVSDEQWGKIFSGKQAGAVFNFQKSFRDVTGRSYPDMEREWKKAMSVYFNWREGVSERTETVGVPLDKIPCEYLQVIKSSPDRKVLALTGVKSVQSRSYDLFLWDPIKKRMRLLAAKNIDPNFSFDPDGRRIAFSRLHYGDNGSLISDLYAVDLQTGKETAMTRNAQARDPVFIGTNRIVFIRQEGLISNFYQIRSDDGSPPEKLTDFQDERHFSDLSVSQGGKKVAASFLDPNRKQFGFVILDLETKIVDEKLTPALGRFPLFSPENAEEILYTSQEDDVPNVYRLELQTGRRERVTNQSNYIIVTDWTDKSTALGIRQTQRQTNEAFTLDPYRKPQLFSGTLQDYYGKWKDTRPSTPIIIETGDAPGRFLGRFHSLSTFRPLVILPLPTLMKEKLSLAVSGEAADMLGIHTLTAGLAFNFRKLADTNYSLSYRNRSTLFDIRASYGYTDVTTYRFENQNNLYEGLTRGELHFSLPFDHSTSYTTHRLSFSLDYQKSDILEDPFKSNSGAKPYRQAGFSFGYHIKNIQPFSSFPKRGFGAAGVFTYAHSLAGGDFSYQYFHLSAFSLQPVLGNFLNLRLAAELQVLEGRTPPQNRLGMAKYQSSAGFMAFSDQIYIRGGDRYVPGNRLLTASLELHGLRLSGMAELVPFLDLSKVWESGVSGWKNGTGLTSWGLEIQLANILGRYIGLGAVRNISDQHSGKWKYYIAVKSLFPF